MPELPEARTIARRLDEALAGLAVARVELLRRDMLKTGFPRDLAALAGQTVARVDTRGKYVILHAERARLVVQLGMAGRLILATPDRPVEPHTHLRLHFPAGRELRYANTRRIAAGLHVLPPGQDDLGPLALLGPEATEIPVELFVQAVGSRRRAVKAALLDQGLLAGLGNIYTDEALFRAAIRPARRADRLSRESLARLHQAVREVLAEAIAAGGSSLSDANPFVGADGELGYFASRHRVYGRRGLPCEVCGSTLRGVVVGGRTGSYCPHCQA